MRRRCFPLRAPWRRLGLALALGVAGSLLKAQSPAAQSTPLELERLRLAYFSEAGSLRRQYDAADAQLLSQYGEAVARFARESQARGEFEAWQAGNQERERFNASKRIDKAELVATPAGLRALQERAIESRIELRRTFARNTVDLTDKLVARFEALKRELTIRGDAVGAQLTVDAIARARAAATYTEALFALDDPSAPLPSAETREERPTDAQDAPRSSGFRVPNAPGIRVYEPGRMPPAAAATYRLCHLVSTPASTEAPAKATATARYVLRPQAQVQFPDKQYTADAIAVQVAVQMLPDVGSSGPLAVVVEYFGRRSAEEVEALTFTAANLASLDTRPVTIDMPLTSYQIRVTDSAFGGARRQYDKSLFFGGLVISVFDASGAILYQGVTERGLLPLANDAKRYRADGLLNRPEEPAPRTEP